MKTRRCCRTFVAVGDEVALEVQSLDLGMAGVELLTGATEVVQLKRTMN